MTWEKGGEWVVEVITRVGIRYQQLTNNGVLNILNENMKRLVSLTSLSSLVALDHVVCLLVFPVFVLPVFAFHAEFVHFAWGYGTVLLSTGEGY